MDTVAQTASGSPSPAADHGDEPDGSTADRAEAVEEQESSGSGTARPSREEAALKTVRGYVYGAVGVGLIPAPVVDLAGLTGLQLKMIHSLAQQYGLGFREDVGKSSIASFLGALGPITLARGTFGSLVKAIPVVGTAIGIAAQPVLAGAFTHAVGKAFIQHFESGGTFLDLNPGKVRSYFAQQFQEGKLLASKIFAEKQAGE